MENLCIMSLNFFKEHSFNVLAEPLKNSLIKQISKDREGNKVDWNLLKNCIQAFVYMGIQKADIVKLQDEFVWKGDKNLSIYETKFEKFLIQKTREEYQQMSAGWLGKFNCPEYL